MNTPVPLSLHRFHAAAGATFSTLSGSEMVAQYRDPAAEHGLLRSTAGLLDLSFRGRLCLVGADRVRFLHGQVTNDVKRLRAGAGCYAALTTAKGKMQSDLNIFCLQDELLLDFEPGLTALVSERLDKYIVADDVQVVDVAPHYGLLSVQGPQAVPAVQALGWGADLPSQLLGSIKISDAALGEVYVANHPRCGGAGFDLFIPIAAMDVAAKRLQMAVESVGGALCGWEAFELARVEAGIPRFGVDMDDTNLASECGIEARAISYQKGCYIGQEVLNRIHSIGHVNRELRGLVLSGAGKTLPARGDRLFQADREVGHVTSAVLSPVLNQRIALGYVRREANAIGTKLTVRCGEAECDATVTSLPFQPAAIC